MCKTSCDDHQGDSHSASFLLNSSNTPQTHTHTPQKQHQKTQQPWLTLTKELQSVISADAAGDGGWLASGQHFLKLTHSLLQTLHIHGTMQPAVNAVCNQQSMLYATSSQCCMQPAVNALCNQQSMLYATSSQCSMQPAVNALQPAENALCNQQWCSV